MSLIFGKQSQRPMDTLQWRVNVGSLALLMACSVVGILPASAQSKRPVAAGAGGAMVASVNGEKITRDQVVTDILLAQTAKLNATNPIFKDRNRMAAGTVGALVLKKMAANGGKSAAVTHDEIVNFFFAEKSDALYQTVQRMIQEKAINQTAKRLGITVSDKVVNAKLAESVNVAREQYHLEGGDAAILAQIGVSAAFLRPFVRTQLLLEQMVRRDLEKQWGHPIGDKDYVIASHVLVAVMPTSTNPGQTADPAETEKQFEEAKKKIVAIAADIKSGKTTFEKAAQANNTDSTKLTGGSLGAFTRGQMLPEFDKVAFSQEKGVVGEPVRTIYGWHLVRVDRFGTEMTGKEKKQLYDRLLQSRVNPKVTEIVKACKIVNTLPAPAPQPGGQMMPGE